MKKEYLKTLKKCEALLSKDEAEFLLNLPRIIPEQGVIVEIGSYKGGSTCMLAEGSKINKKGRGYTIDPNISNLQSLKENIKNAGVEDRVTIITKTSEKAGKKWKEPISLLWIDGDHDYNYVKMDFLLWEKYLVRGGVIAIHDSRKSKHKMLSNNKEHRYLSGFSGPRKIVRKYILNSKRFKNIGFVDTITHAKKIKDYSTIELLKKSFSIYKCKLIIEIKTLYKKIDKNIGLIDKNIGLLGIYLKKHSPRLYFKLKRLKDFKFKK